jgi:hypothetical protein
MNIEVARCQCRGGIYAISVGSIVVIKCTYVRECSKDRSPNSNFKLEPVIRTDMLNM